MRAEHLEFAEPERYELHEAPFYHFELSRRGFLETLGAGLLICMTGPVAFGQRAGRGSDADLSQRLHIGVDGLLTVLTSKVEVGQGSRTQLTQAAAEELGVSVEQVRLVMADTALVPDDGGTAGSRTTPSTVPAVRRACAAARRLLLQIAADKFQVPEGGLSVRDGKVEGLGEGKEFSYGELARGEYAKALQTGGAKRAAVTEVSQWRVLGTPVSRRGAREIVTGVHRYPSDIARPGMLYGKILRPPAYGARLKAIDLAPAEALPGVVAVRDGDFVGFAAPTSFAAEEAREAASKTAEWIHSPHPSSDELFEYLRAHASKDRARREVSGEPEAKLQSAAKVVRQTYRVAYIQHAPMEPRAAVAEWENGRVTVWTGTQQPARVHEEVGRALRLSGEAVRIIVPDTGGGFGGKHSGEVAVEAARLAQAAKKPVSIRWTREEEFTWAYFRPAGVMDLAAGLDGNGTVVAWEHINFNSGASALPTPYRVANRATEFRACEQPLRSGSYRALAATANTFARESFMDELAEAAGTDPLAFRLKHLEDERLRNVLLAATERFGWAAAWKASQANPNTGIGLACGTEKGSYVACCVELSIHERQFRVVRVSEAFECGAVQNPANLQSQIHGAIIQGLGGALWEEARFKEGKLRNARFSQYHVPRFRHVPEIDAVLVNRPDLPSVGAGETPIIAVAPAIANALWQARKVRIRAMPIREAEWQAIL